MTSAADTSPAGRRARRLEWFTIVYNLVEGIVAVVAALAAGSVVLLSFGLDSIIELMSAVVVVWQLSRPPSQRVERRAMRLIAIAFFALAGWILLNAARVIVDSDRPEPSLVGIVVTAASVIVMPTLILAKRRAGRALDSPTVLADSTYTLLSTLLSAIALAGLALNAALNWTWADPLAALGVAVLAVYHGAKIWPR